MLVIRLKKSKNISKISLITDMLMLLPTAVFNSTQTIRLKIVTLNMGN